MHLQDQKCPKEKTSEVITYDNGSILNGQRNLLTKDEYHLATLGYRQELVRRFGFFESWAATLSTMNVVSGMPVLFAFAMYSGGPQAAFANWTMVGGFSVIVSLALAEIAAALPTAGGIYFWAYRLGGSEWGPLISWLTAWWNWAGWITVIPGVQQGSTNFLLSALTIKYPEAEILSRGWFAWLLTSIGLIIALIPNISTPGLLKIFFRLMIACFFTLFLMYWIWFPVRASANGNHFNSHQVFAKFYNGINLGKEEQASDSYCWVISILFPAWIFYGFDTSAHLSEELVDASSVVARGIWSATLSGWLLSVPTLAMIIICMQDFDAIISATYANNWAEYLVQLLGKNGAVAMLAILWFDGTCCSVCCILSAQRVTYAISRDGALPFSRFFRKLSKNKIPVNAAILVVALGIAITTAVIGSTVAFTALTATATIATNVSYIFPIVARHTVGSKNFTPAKWNLGWASRPIGIIAALYISFLSVVLILPQVYPVTGQTLNYAPVCIGSIAIISIAGWIMPRYGGRNWFQGPIKTITEEEVRNARIKEQPGSDGAADSL